MRHWLILFWVLSLAVPVCGVNMLVNGDFETGDLYGWKEQGPSNYSWVFQAWGVPPVPAQVFSAEIPMSVIQVWYGKGTIRHLRRLGCTEDIRPIVRAGNRRAMGWTRTGWDHFGYPWISQYFRVAPGKYLMNASWDVAVWNREYQGEGFQGMAVAGMFMVHVDKDVDSYTLDETAFRKTVWNTESKGKWIHNDIRGARIETRTGNVEVRLQYLQNKPEPPDAGEPLRYPDYEFVAFDNVELELIPAGPAEITESEGVR